LGSVGIALDRDVTNEERLITLVVNLVSFFAVGQLTTLIGGSITLLALPGAFLFIPLLIAAIGVVAVFLTELLVEQAIDNALSKLRIRLKFFVSKLYRARATLG